MSSEITRLTLTEVAAAIRRKKLSSVEVTRACIAQAERVQPRINCFIALEAEAALKAARRADLALRRGARVGPLHGVPVVLKASIDTADAMATTAGSLALAEHRPAADAELVARLRAAGAVIVAKANLSEWANFRSTRSTSGWSSLGGQTHNAYVLDRNPCGSSSGSAVAVAAGLVPLAVGTETDGSIVCPSGVNGIVGIKPTLGLVSQHGIIPIAASQDTAGPMARSVAGAALLLAAMQTSEPETVTYATARRDLNGLRLGVVRDYQGAKQNPDVEAAFTRALALLAAAGAELVDPIEVAVPEGAGDAELDDLIVRLVGLDHFLKPIDERGMRT